MSNPSTPPRGGATDNFVRRIPRMSDTELIQHLHRKWGYKIATALREEGKKRGLL